MPGRRRNDGVAVDEAVLHFDRATHSVDHAAELDEAAVASLEDVKKAVDGGYRTFYAYINLAAAHAFKGEMDEAKAAMAEARRLKPDLSVKWLVKHKPVLQRGGLFAPF